MAARLQNGNGYRRPPSGSMFAPSTVLIALAVVACEFQSGSLLYVNAQQATTSSAKGCVTDYDPSANVDYFPDKAVIAYAENFDVEYFNSYKVLTTMSPWSGNTSTYVLYQCGTTMPVLEDVDVLHYISVPVKSVATGTPSHIPRIEVSRVLSVNYYMECSIPYEYSGGYNTLTGWCYFDLGEKIRERAIGVCSLSCGDAVDKFCAYTAGAHRQTVKSDIMCVYISRSQVERKSIRPFVGGAATM